MWGFVPCGLVYSALAVAALTADPVDGAAVMLAFGVGTLPAIAGAQWVIQRIASGGRAQVVRRLTGVALLGFGVVGLVRATGLPNPGDWLALCVQLTGGLP